MFKKVECVWQVFECFSVAFVSVCVRVKSLKRRQIVGGYVECKWIRILDYYAYICKMFLFK